MNEVQRLISPTLWMEKLRHTEAKSLVRVTQFIAVESGLEPRYGL